MSDSISINSSTVDPVVAEALAAIAAAPDIAALRASRNATVGEQSAIAKLNAALKNLPHEEKAAAGALIGQARGELNAAFAAREAELAKALQAVADQGREPSLNNKACQNSLSKQSSRPSILASECLCGWGSPQRRFRRRME